MTDLKEKPVTILKAEAVADVVIEKKGNSYPSDFECVIPVKVGNKVENLTFEYGIDYSSNDRLPKAYIARKSKYNFQALEEAGIEIDYTQVFNVYHDAIKLCKVIIEEAKARKIQKVREERTDFYDNKSWVPEFISNIKNDKRNVDRVLKFHTLEREKYINGLNDLFVIITYKGISGKFFYSDYLKYDRYRNSNPEMKYNVENGFYQLEDNKTQTLCITNDKVRKAKTAIAVAYRWFLDVDEYLAIRESRKRRKMEDDKNRKEYISFLEEKTGLPITAKNEYIWREERNGGGYYFWRYYITLNIIGKETPRKLKIDYSSYHKTYSIDGLNGLNENQFKSIIEIMQKKVQ